MWGVFLLASLAAVAVGQLAREAPGPVWLRMSILLFPPVLALVAGAMCLFSLGCDLLVRSGREADLPGQRRGGLMRDALQIGSPAWSTGFVLAVAVSSSLVSLTRYAALPQWLRVLIALIPAVPLVMYLRSVSRDPAEVDELALQIRRDAYGFVFWATIGLVVCVYFLGKAGVMPGFRWSPLQLAATMSVLLFVGAAISSRRFR